MYALKKKFRDHRIVLATNSPRRKALFGELGMTFHTASAESDETYPPGLPKNEIPVFLAVKKAESLSTIVDEKTLLITADTIVCFGDEVLNKPSDKKEATGMLEKLSGEEHQVITGMCIYSKQKKVTFDCLTKVRFRELADEEISYYVENYRPFDKAGAYGIQEWIGYIGVERIEGSYFNVVGLPVHKLYSCLIGF